MKFASNAGPLVGQLALASAAGAATVLSFAPFHFWPIAVITLAILFSLWQRATTARRAFAIGFMWALGLFLTGVSWLYVSLHVYGNMPAVLAGASIFIFCVYLSLFLAIAGWAQAKFSGSFNLSSPVKLLLLMPASFVAAEVIRAWFVSGFPWLTIGYSQTPSANLITPLAGFAPVFGAFGISALLAFSAAVIVFLSPQLSNNAKSAKPTVSRFQRRFLIAGTLSIWVTGVLLMSYQWSSPVGSPMAVSLIQGNVGQHLKFRSDQLQPTIDNYLELVERSRGQLIVLPETALPLWLDDVPLAVQQRLANKANANNGNIVLGIAYQQLPTPLASMKIYNGAVSLGRDPSQRFAKQHLVAFGEFIPPFFSWVYRWLDMPLSGFTPGSKTQAPMRLSGQLVAINICYEDAFGREIARALPEATLLVNISNMAWFGRTLAADQHAQFSQMRALETSRWMLRATNTGVTAAIDEKGNIVAALPQFTRGVLEATAVPREGITPYVMWRDWPVCLWLLGVLVFAFVKRRCV